MNSTKLFLHCCCGPCALYPLQILREEGLEAIGYFYNPNVHPWREFRSRLEAFASMAGKTGLPARIEEGYGLEAFMIGMKGLGDDAYQAESADRCRMCYRLRLEKTAAACRDAGIGAFSTTLLVSPYQRHDLIRETGEAVAEEYGLSFLYRDFRPGFRRGQAMAKEMGLYRQGYCGCVFSEYGRYGSAKSPASATGDAPLGKKEDGVYGTHA